MDILARVVRANAALRRLLQEGVPVCVSWSAGKDSSCVLNLVLNAAAQLSLEGKKVPPIVVTHADTMVESPEMQLYAANEMIQVRAFARRFKLDLAIEVATPNLTDQWAVRVIGGRALPPFPGTNRDCTLSWKINPQSRLRKSVLSHLAKRAGGAAPVEPVILLGTRYEESEERARSMQERGESDVEVRRGVDAAGKPGNLFLSPIAHWTADDVWEYLGYVRAGSIDGYSDFDETFRLYSAAVGGSCVVVAEDMSKALKSSKACGARFGCWACTAVSADQSMENMLAMDERYAYMRGLNKLRNFLANTRWDMGRRTWLGRSIENGYVRISPDVYSPAMLEELLRYCLTIDAREGEAARALGIRPRFQLIGVEQLFAIDAMWSLQAYHRPFHALKIFQEIEGGARYDVPHLQPVPRPKEIPARYLWVGDDWDCGEDLRYTGLNSAIHELTAMDSTGCMGSKELADGRTVMDVNTGQLMEIDVEAAFFVLDEAKELIARFHDDPRCCPTQAYRHYLGLGMLSIKAGLQGEVDRILRRSSFKVREGIAESVDWRELWERAVSPEEAGRSARAGAGRRARGEAGSRSTAHLSLDEPRPQQAAPLVVVPKPDRSLAEQLALQQSLVQADLALDFDTPVEELPRMRA